MYNDIIVKHFTQPSHAQELTDSDTSLEIGNPVCGDRVRVKLAFEGEGISRARYQAWGCATSLATGNVFCTHVEGKSVSELRAMTRQEIAVLLGDLEPAQQHCVDLLVGLFDQIAQKEVV
jgi:nitrogen fixation NifU-like protein